MDGYILSQDAQILISVCAKEVKRGIWSLFNHCLNAIAAAAILSVMFGGELMYLQIVSAQTMQITAATYLLRNNKNVCDVSLHKKHNTLSLKLLTKPKKQKNLRVQ